MHMAPVPRVFNPDLDLTPPGWPPPGERIRPMSRALLARAMRLPASGTALVMQDVAMPAPRPQELLLRVRACGGFLYHIQLVRS